MGYVIKNEKLKMYMLVTIKSIAFNEEEEDIEEYGFSCVDEIKEATTFDYSHQAICIMMKVVGNDYDWDVYSLEYCN